MACEAFWAKIKDRLDAKTISGGGDCILWTGGVDRHGYGRMKVTWPNGSKSEVGSHRLAFMLENKLLKSEMPTHDEYNQPLDISHLCHHKACVNVTHLVMEPRCINNDRKHCRNLNYCSGQHAPPCMLPVP